MSNPSKDLAIKCMEELGIYKPYIRKFTSKAGVPCFFENYGGFYADQEDELWQKIKEVEKQYNCIVYAVTHEFSDIGETWSMLCVSNGAGISDLVDYIEHYAGTDYCAHAYVWNKSFEYCSEFGDVVVRCFGGGIKRVG